MIRGAIESVSRNLIYGWIWSPDAPIAGRTVQAFLDDVCIGAGPVEGMRDDLREAGLGDGIAGFNFNITYANPADAPRVVVRLEGSDAVVLQQRARVMPPASPRAGHPARQKPSLDSLQWMRARGWLTQSELDFLRLFRQLGVAERSLVIAPDPAAPRLDAAETARSLLQLERMDEGVIRRETVEAPRDWRRIAEEQEIGAGPGAALAAWSATAATLPVVEGSHLKPLALNADEEGPAGAPYAVGPDRLLFLDARILFGAGASFPPGGLDLFFLAT